MCCYRPILAGQIYEPFNIPAPVPWHFREKVKAGLEADCRMGVLEEVPANSPAEWMSYSKRYNDILRGTKDIDDVCQWDETVEGSFWKACKFLEHCSNNRITFNPEKFVFARDDVEYVGLEVTMDSVNPASFMLKAIKEFPFPAPTNIT